MNNIKITTIIPVYNVANYLEEMLDSVFNQSLKEIQVIIVNDGSTDNSKEIIEKYLDKFDNLLYLEQENAGVSSARNLALKYILGKYTIFLDSDDYIEKDMLKLMYEKAEKEYADTVICGYKKIYDYESEKKNKDYIFNVYEDKVYTNVEVCEKMLSMEIEGFTWNKLFLSKNIKNSIYFDTERTIEDWFPVFKEICESNRIAFVNKPLYYYRQRQTSALHQKNIKKINDYNFAVKSILNYIKRNNMSINKDKYYEFIAKTQSTQIFDYVAIDKKVRKNIYDKYKLNDLNNYKILTGINCQWKIKLKLILFNLGILHYIY